MRQCHFCVVAAYTIGVSFEEFLAARSAGLDFDIENGTADVPKLMRALYSVQTNHKNLFLSFTLAVLPEGLTHEGEVIIKTANENHLNYHVNIMAMDYGPAYTNDMGQYAIQAATNVKEFLQSLYPEKSENELWQMVEVTPMIGVNDVSIEQCRHAASICKPG